MKRLLLLAALPLISFHALAGEATFPSSAGNVSFNEVLALGSEPANEKIAYGSENPELQYGELWLPADASMTRRAPVVVFIHGGCWQNSFDISYSYPLTTALAAEGYAVWSLEYRRTGDIGGGWPGTYQDIRAGLEYVNQLTDQPIDTSNIIITGHSAGGQLAMLAGVDYPQVAGVVGLAAISDIVTYAMGSNSCQTATSEFMGGDYDAEPAAYAAANPVAKELHKNTILLQGDIDAIVPVTQSQIPNVEMILQSGAGHFDWVHPGTPAYAQFLTSLERIFAQ